MRKYRLAIIIIMSFSAFIGYLVFPNKIFFYIMIMYAILSVLTFFIYKIDKSAAEKGSWRTSENTLHFFATLGGWPGAMIGQQVFNHKTKKTSFRIIFWISILLNISLLTLFLIYTPWYNFASY